MCTWRPQKRPQLSFSLGALLERQGSDKRLFCIVVLVAELYSALALVDLTVGVGLSVCARSDCVNPSSRIRVRQLDKSCFGRSSLWRNQRFNEGLHDGLQIASGDMPFHPPSIPRIKETL